MSSQVSLSVGGGKAGMQSSVSTLKRTLGNLSWSGLNMTMSSAMSNPMLPAGHPILVPSLLQMVLTVLTPSSSVYDMKIGAAIP